MTSSVVASGRALASSAATATAARRRPVELPTLALAVGIYAAWLVTTAGFTRMPLWLAAPLGGLVIAWHGSLQHEAVHGHPTGRRWLDLVIAGPPLGLWLPFPLYRAAHLAHHRTPRLTDPIDDPESYYAAPGRWRRMTAPERALAWALQTGAGRLVLGPPVVAARLWMGEAGRLLRGPERRWRARVWACHALASAAVWIWILGPCHISPLAYLGYFVYPGLSLTLLRSFAEHRPDPDQHRRTVVVESGRFLSLLYLNNNLHVVHHAAPRAPWYRLPALYRAGKERYLAQNGGYWFRGYGQILLRYGVRPKDAPVHPGACGQPGATRERS